MSQSIIISSENFDGQLANILFKPDNDNIVLNLGDVIIPFNFQPSLLVPQREIYGSYTIFVLSGGCTNILNVVRPTATPTPTITVTKTPTPTPTLTPTPTTTFDPCNFPTPTSTPKPSKTPKPTVTPTPTVTSTPCFPPSPSVTKTPTPTPTPVYFAYLFIEPMSGASSIGQWMFDGGSNFFGFTNASQPTQNQTTFNLDMNRYIDFTGWTSGEFPRIITQTVPQVNGGTDSFGNSKVAYNFLTTEILENSIGGNAWYTWIIPTLLTNNETQVLIDVNTSNNPNLLTAVATEGTINSYTFTYSGGTIPNVVYKVYTTFPNTIFQITDSQNIYFRGNATSP